MTSKLFLTAAAACVLGGCAAVPPAATTMTTATTTTTTAGPPAGWKLVWSDEFDDASGSGLPDPANWRYDTARNKEGWYNSEQQYYANARPQNSRVQGGRLIIEARRERLTEAADYGGQPYTSARLTTNGVKAWTYGFFETRAKLPCGLGTWPAIWMLGTSGTWPQLGEIDIMEHVGRKQGEVLGTVHTGAYNHVIHTQKGGAVQVPDVCNAFHNYQLTWTADKIDIGVDGKVYFTFENPRNGDKAQWPFDAPQYLLLNLAMGGQLGGPVDDKILPVQMEVDYVRVYQARN
jgi:beta-glucanase (GH16 family)